MMGWIALTSNNDMGKANQIWPWKAEAPCLFPVSKRRCHANKEKDVSGFPLRESRSHLRRFNMRASILALLAATSAALAIDPNQPPVWSTSYSVTGTLIIPFAEIEEPFSAWFDGQNGRSRIDYYGGMDKTFQRADMGQHGTAFKVVPMTDESISNSETCFLINGSDAAPVAVQPVLPDLRGFTLKGYDVRGGRRCERWRRVEFDGGKINRYTVWLRRVRSALESRLETAVPVHYEMKGLNTLLGSHYDHYYLSYEVRLEQLGSTKTLPQKNVLAPPLALARLQLADGAHGVSFVQPALGRLHGFTVRLRRQLRFRGRGRGRLFRVPPQEGQGKGPPGRSGSVDGVRSIVLQLALHAFDPVQSAAKRLRLRAGRATHQEISRRSRFEVPRWPHFGPRKRVTEASEEEATAALNAVVMITLAHSWTRNTMFLFLQNFDISTPAASLFDPHTHGMRCRDWPGPGDAITHRVYFANPISEFISGEDGHMDETFDAFRAKHGKRYVNGHEHEVESSGNGCILM